MLGDDLVEALGAADGGGGAHGAFDHQDVGLGAVEGLSQPLAGQHALGLAVGADEAGVQGRIGAHGAVSDDDGDARILGLLQHHVPAGFLHGADHDVVHFLLDEVADSFHLSGVVVVGVHEEQLVAVLGGEGVLVVEGVGSAPVALMADLGETDGDDVLGGGNGEHAKRQDQGKGNRKELFHDRPSIYSIGLSPLWIKLHHFAQDENKANFQIGWKSFFFSMPRLPKS